MNLNEPMPELRCKQTSVAKTLWPLQAGTLKLVRRFGKALVCVRYRHDAAGLRRLTTVELVVDIGPIASRQSDQRVYGVRIGLHEDDLRARAKAHGATWDKPAKLWRMRGKAVKLLDLYDRVAQK
jgi:hypothetical protein